MIYVTTAGSSAQQTEQAENSQVSSSTVNRDILLRANELLNEEPGALLTVITLKLHHHTVL